MVVIAMGSSLAERERALRDAFEPLSCRLVFAANVRQLREALEKQLPYCVVAGTAGDMHDAARLLRSVDQRTPIPLIVLTNPKAEWATLGLFALGADDVLVESDLAGLCRRVRMLMQLQPQHEPPMLQGRCVVAHEDPGKRQLFAGVLTQAGFDVLETVDANETLSALTSPPRFLLVSANLPPHGGKAALETLGRRLPAAVPAVVIASHAYAGSRSASGHWMMSENAPPADLMFVIHEMLRPPQVTESRTSPRFLHATPCSFGVASELHESTLALTYNISGEGLYVRTLDAPLPGSEVWIALRPPGASTVVRLGGTVMWARQRLASGISAAPPGFGLRLDPTQCPPAGLSTYTHHYGQMRRMMSVP